MIDCEFDGILATDVVPEHALITVHYNDKYLVMKCEDGKYYLPLICIPTVEKIGIDPHMFHPFDVKMFCRQILDDIFDSIEDTALEFWRSEFSNKILIVDITIDCHVIIKDKHNLLFKFDQYDQIDKIYHESCKYYWNLDPI